VVTVSTAPGLVAALESAAPGDCINLAVGTYSLEENLTITRSGTPTAPITIQGVFGSTIIDGSGTRNISITASYLSIRKIRFTDLGVQSLWCQGMAYSVLDSLEIDHTAQAGIRLIDASHHNVIQRSRIHDTGTGPRPEFGEGIYVGNSGGPGFPLQFTNTDNQILHNAFGPNVTSQAVDVKEGSDRTLIRGNAIDGTGTQDIKSEGSVALMDIIASHVTVDSNSFQYGSPHGIAFWAPTTVAMSGNLVAFNTVDLQNIHDVDFTTRPFYAFDRSEGTTDTTNVRVQCNNTVTNGTFSNVDCTPEGGAAQEARHGPAVSPSARAVRPRYEPR